MHINDAKQDQAFFFDKFPDAKMKGKSSCDEQRAGRQAWRPRPARRR
jgi:hypothetical protein